MKEIETWKFTGKLEKIIRLKSWLGLEVGVEVERQVFLKRYWRRDETSPKKENEPEKGSDDEISLNEKIKKVLLSQEEFNYKEKFIEEQMPHIGEIVSVRFKEVKVGLLKYFVDCVIVGPRYPRRYNEILSLSYQNNQDNKQ